MLGVIATRCENRRSDEKSPGGGPELCLLTPGSRLFATGAASCAIRADFEQTQQRHFLSRAFITRTKGWKYRLAGYGRWRREVHDCFDLPAYPDHRPDVVTSVLDTNNRAHLVDPSCLYPYVQSGSLFASAA